jgi:uncharacterized protein
MFTDLPDEELALRLCAKLREYGPPAIAYSGGVDSTVVMKAAYEVWGPRAVAVTAVSPSLANSDLQIAIAEAQRVGIRHELLATDEFTLPEYRRNAGDRCFHCKHTLYRLSREQLAKWDVICLLNGTNQDDLGDHRPGLQAAADHGVSSPLAELGYGKREVRRLARSWQLSVSEKPASPCLASRIAYGVEVTAERVQRIEQAEAWLKERIAVDELRVRLEAGELARIEVPLEVLSRLLEPDCRASTVHTLRGLGFRAVTLDLEGFRSGSLNSLLPLLEPAGT